MFVHYQNADSWNNLCQELRVQYSIEDGIFFHLYPNAKVALWETVLGISRLFTHKKEIAFLKPIAPIFEDLINHLMSSGISVKKWSEIPTLDSFKPNQLLAVVWQVDDPFTGALNSIHSDAVKFVEANKLFSLKINSSELSFSKRQRPAVSEASIYSVNSNCFLHAGERWRFEPMITPSFPWEKINTGISNDPEQKAEILNFEKNLPLPFKPLLAIELRIFNRAVFYSEKFDGSSVCDLLCKKLNIKMSIDLNTMSWCHWGDDQLLKSYREQGFSDEQLRGTVMLQAKYANNETLSVLKEIVEELTKLQEIA